MKPYIKLVQQNVPCINWYINKYDTTKKNPSILSTRTRQMKTPDINVYTNIEMGISSSLCVLSNIIVKTKE